MTAKLRSGASGYSQNRVLFRRQVSIHAGSSGMSSTLPLSPHEKPGVPHFSRLLREVRDANSRSYDRVSKRLIAPSEF
jgi:hypothetical protein